MAKQLFDVLIVGAGNAGLCAAIAAVERGARVAVLEKAPKTERGGNSALTGHMRFPYESVDDLVPLIDNPAPEDLEQVAARAPRRNEADVWDEIMRVTEGHSDRDLAETHVREGYNTVRWLRDRGHAWEFNFGMTTGNVIRMKGGGYQLQKRNFTLLEQRGVEFFYNTALSDLLQDDKLRVTGVHAATPDGRRTFHAKSVILTCGGFEGNPEMRARYLGPRWDTVRMRGVPFNTGEGLHAALEIGAMPYGSWSSCHASPQDAERPWFSLPSEKESGDVGWVRYAYPFSVMVNVHGQRFVDEADEIRALTYAKMGRAILAQPGGIAFQIFDAKARRYGILDAYDRDNATGAQAQTLEGLAGELGIDPRGLVQTIRQFNAAIQPGPVHPSPFKKDGKRTDGLNPNKSNFSISVDEGPFEGYAVRCGITFTFGGLKVNPKTAQVQHVGGWDIAGLYTAGEMLGGLWHWNYPSGGGMLAGSTFGRIAGTAAATAAIEPRS